MVWTVWGWGGKVEGTTITRSNMDGSAQKDIVFTDLDKPNGLALDVVSNRLYWANYGRARIETCDIHGNGRIQLVEQAKKVYGLTLVSFGARGSVRIVMRNTATSREIKVKYTRKPRAQAHTRELVLFDDETRSSGQAFTRDPQVDFISC